MIDSRHVSFESIKADVDKHIKSLENYSQITKTFTASNIEEIKDLMAGFGAYITYNQIFYRRETFLSQATLESSVYRGSRVFGYIINRYTTPSIKLQYIGLDSLTLRGGEKLGTYKTYDLFYFGNNRVVSNLDFIDVFIGHYREQEFDVVFRDDIFSIDLNPNVLKAIDNRRIKLFINDIENEISPNIEDYVVFNKVTDYSNNPFSTVLFVSDRVSSYGINVTESSNVRVSLIETDGELSSDFLLSDLIFSNDNYIASEVNHRGTNGDSLAKIKQLAPLLFSTLRRMVTKKDHKYIAEYNPFIKSASIERDLGVPLKLRIMVNANTVSENYSVSIGGYNYFIVNIGFSDLDILKNLEKTFTSNMSIHTSIENGALYLESTDSRNDLDVEVSGNLTKEVIVQNIKPASCTVKIHYVLNNVVDDPITLTSFEFKEVSDYFQNYKMVGVRLVLLPAEVYYKDLKLKVKLIDNTHLAEVTEKAKVIISDYELTLEKDFDYGEVLTKISDIVVIKDGEEIEPVISILPNQEIFHLAGTKNMYFKFNFYLSLY